MVKLRKTRSDSGINRFGDKEIIERNSCPEPNSGCWLWLGHLNPYGYGRLGRNRIERQAHRLSFLAHIGPIPDELKVLHKCDIPSCVNPDHLFLGTDEDNMQDMVTKGRNVNPSGEDHPMAKLNYKDIQKIRENKISTISAIADHFGVSRRAIRFVKTGETWSR